MTIQDYIAANRERFIEEWSSLIRIPSVSCQAEHKPDMLRCANRWRELLLEAGCQKAEVIAASSNSECSEAPSAGNPFVYAEYSLPFTGEELCSIERPVDGRRTLLGVGSFSVNVSIRRLRPFQHHIRTFFLVQTQKTLIQFAALCLQNTNCHLYSRFAQHLHTFSRHQRIRI